MSETIKFNFDTACNLTNTLTECMDILEMENDRLQTNFTSLNSEFNDAYYNEFKSEFDKGDACIKRIRETVRDLTIAICNYGVKMGEMEHGGSV